MVACFAQRFPAELWMMSITARQLPQLKQGKQENLKKRRRGDMEGTELDNLLIFPETESFNSTVSGDGVKSCPVVWGSLWSYMGVLVVLLFWVS